MSAEKSDNPSPEINLSEAEKAQIDADQKILEERVVQIITDHIPPDMGAANTVLRGRMLITAFGMSRTTVYGALLYAGTYAPIVGLTKEQIINMVTELYDAVESLPSIKIAKDTYQQQNAEYHLKKLLKETEGMTVN